MSGTAEQTGVEGGTGAPPPDPAQQTNGEDFEARARGMGWRPRNEWTGPDYRWVDAKTFVERGERIIPVQRERNAALEKRIQEQQGQISEMRDMMAQQIERTRRAEQIGYKRAMRELEAQKAEAVRNADPVAVARVDEQIRDMGPDPLLEQRVQQPAPQPQQQQNTPDPIVVDWVDDNPWVTQNPAAWDMAVVTLNRVRAERPRTSLEEQLAEVKKRVMPLFVQDAGSSAPSRRDAPAAVARSQSAGVSTRVQPRTFAAMPLEVQKQYEKEKRVLHGKGKELTREEFAEYYWDQFPVDDGVS